MLLFGLCSHFLFFSLILPRILDLWFMFKCVRKCICYTFLLSFFFLFSVLGGLQWDAGGLPSSPRQFTVWYLLAVKWHDSCDFNLFLPDWNKELLCGDGVDQKSRHVDWAASMCGLATGLVCGAGRCEIMRTKYTGQFCVSNSVCHRQIADNKKSLHFYRGSFYCW